MLETQVPVEHTANLIEKKFTKLPVSWSVSRHYQWDIGLSEGERAYVATIELGPWGQNLSHVYWSEFGSTPGHALFNCYKKALREPILFEEEKDENGNLVRADF